MKDSKLSTVRSYRESLINSLKNPEHAAGYIAMMLKLDEEGYDNKMLIAALAEVVEARKRTDTFSDTAEKHYKKLDKILTESGGKEILKLIEFLDALGYQISLVDKE